MNNLVWLVAEDFGGHSGTPLVAFKTRDLAMQAIHEEWRSNHLSPIHERRDDSIMEAYRYSWRIRMLSGRIVERAFWLHGIPLQET